MRPSQAELLVLKELTASNHNCTKYRQLVSLLLKNAVRNREGHTELTVPSRSGCTVRRIESWEVSMNNLLDCRGMELLYRERAKADPEHSTKWLGQAERWRELARYENAWRVRPHNTSRMQMHPGPMAMGPNTIRGDTRSEQQG